MKNWLQKATKSLFESKYFRLRVDECEDFHGKTVPKYYVVDFPDWVQVLALDEHNNVVMVEQYRYPGQGWFLEFPGGTTHASPHQAGQSNEKPLDAAHRELAEETGYTSNNWIELGEHFPNPALMSNRCHAFLALDCKKTQELNLDPFEELRVKLVPINELDAKLCESKNIHSLMLATLSLYKNYLEKEK